MLSPSAQRVQDALTAIGVKIQVIELPASTRTSAEAAEAVGCQVGQIAKSLIFKKQVSEQPVLVIASGANRVSEARLAALIGEPVEKADADFVKVHTGFAIGGVPPVGHHKKLQTFIDEDLLEYQEIWAAAGTPHAIFRLTPRELIALSGGQVTTVKK